MTASLLLSWRDGVTTLFDSSGQCRLSRGPVQLTLRNLNNALLNALKAITEPGRDEDEVSEEILAAGGPASLAAWYHRLNDLAQRGFLSRTLSLNGERLLTLIPLGRSFNWPEHKLRREHPYKLSRFAYLHHAEGKFLLESPLSETRIVLEDSRAATLITSLSESFRPLELTNRYAALPSDVSLQLLEILASVHIIHPLGSEDPEEALALQTWEFHDLLFHTRTRQGRTDAPYGATYRMMGRLDPPPALKPEPFDNQPPIDLSRPDPPSSALIDARFLDVLEQRRSLRDYSKVPITSRQLGEFLHRVARVKGRQEVQVQTPGGPMALEFASRPYPAGGGLYELEVYAAVQACDGLANGLYRYNPLTHQLHLECGQTPELRRLIGDAAASAGIDSDRVQVLLIITSRFQRIAWKYASISYALTLKHVGVLLQTMYLTATAMNLAPCALGGGDADLFARAAKTDYYSETSVGEFLLGSQPPEGENPP
jgi:SagB-type dehydrogenase family enzyme